MFLEREPSLLGSSREVIQVLKELGVGHGEKVE
jgi:hypothetical protein